jgi:hypothetical protein
MLKNFLFPALLFAAALCTAQNKTVTFNDPNISYEGRILYRSDAAELSWPGTSATIQFEGSSISATLQDLDTANYYNVIIDNQVISKIHTEKIKKCYELATGLSEGKHQVQLFKRTEWDKGKTLFYGFELPKGVKLLPPPAPKKRKIEFYGNSITCGYAIEDNSGKDRSDGYFQNCYLTYGAITARHFDAQYYSNSKSGIGIVISWFPFIMPDIYDRTDPTDSTSKWDFSKYTPDIVVINLFQNDSWLVNMPKHDSFKHYFGTKAPDEATIIAAYRNFVTNIRNKYPDASIICALGNMDATREGSVWPGYIQKAVDQLNDQKIYTHFFPFKNTGGHPNVAEQKTMADDLIGFIEKNIKW